MIHLNGQTLVEFHKAYNMTTAGKIFLAAESFRDSSQVLYLRGLNSGIAKNAKYRLDIVQMVNDAISVELYLKCLLCLQYGEVPKHRKKGHSFVWLYDKLSQDYQGKIEACYPKFHARDVELQKISSVLPNMSISVRDLMISSEDAFHKMRYDFEYGMSNYMLGSVKLAIREVIESVGPEFVRILSPEIVEVYRYKAAFINRNDRSESDLKNVEPIFLSAEAFRDASDLLAWRYNHVIYEAVRIYLFFASETNHALALELYLKTIIKLENALIPNIHDLEKLYDCINSSTRDKIFILYQDTLRQSRRVERGALVGKNKSYYEIPNLLQRGRKAFISFRYPYEDNLDSYALGDLLIAVRNFIVELKPEWPLLLVPEDCVFEPSATFYINK